MYSYRFKEMGCYVSDPVEENTMQDGEDLDLIVGAMDEETPWAHFVRTGGVWHVVEVLSAADIAENKQETITPCKEIPAWAHMPPYLDRFVFQPEDDIEEEDEHAQHLPVGALCCATFLGIAGEMLLPESF